MAYVASGPLLGMPRFLVRGDGVRQRTRRRLVRIVVLGPFAASLLAAPLTGEARGGNIPRIGFIEAGASSTNSHYLEAFRRGLRELGYVEGQNITIEDRWADGQSERFPALLEELIRLKVDVIVQASTPGALAATRARGRVPVVFWGVGDPVGIGLVASLGHPGGNMTGLALGTGDGFGGKWVELFKETLPQVSHVGLVRNPDARGQERVESEVTTAGARLGVAFNRLSVRSLDDLDAAFAAATRAHLGGLIVLTDPLTLRHRARIVQLASQTRLPAVYGFGEFARAGGLMAY